jgi:hypothetical protein
MEVTGQLHHPNDSTAQKETLEPSKETAGWKQQQMLIIQRTITSLMLNERIIPQESSP